MPVAEGSTLAHFKVSNKLGEGGMGEVWRAMDPKLGREVALKVLPEAFTADPERVARFEREARVLASLNHPNIAQIYGLETGAESPTLVMELVEGPTLADRLESGQLSLEESLFIARQVAEALEEAHEKGIIHRDLKPQNVKASIEGKVKVLDFGLAKAMDPSASSAPGVESASQIAESPTLTLGATVQGVILGTAAYMAPEQARGVAVDARVDIWAFGVLLYEMLVGGRLFEGELVTDVLANVIKHEIDFDALPATTPPALRRLLRHCLVRTPKDRLHAIADARLVIDDVLAGRGDEAAGTAPSASAPPASAKWLGRLQWLAAGIVLGAISAVFVVGERAGGAPEAERPASVRALASGGAPRDPAVSRDGRTLAFTAERGGERRVWLKDLGSGSESVLGKTPSSRPAFSPDGTSLLFTTEEGERRDLYRISLATREERLLARHGSSGTWSPDGSTVAFWRTAAADDQDRRQQDLVAVELASGAERVLFRHELGGTFVGGGTPRWSPDGRRLAMVFNTGTAGVADRIGVLDVATGRLEEEVPRLPGLGVLDLRGVDWISDDRLVLLLQDGDRRSTRSGRIARFDLGTRMTVSVLPLQPVAGGVAYAGPGSVIAGLGSSDENLFETRRAADGGWGELARLTDGPYRDRQPIYSPDGSSILFVSDRSGNLDLWRLRRATGELGRLTDHEAVDWDPALSPDGTRLAFSSNRSGRFQIWVAEADGSLPRQLTDVENAQNPTWTGDGEWLVFSRTDSTQGEDGLWRVRPDGSDTSRLSAEAEWAIAETSPDGRYSAARSLGVGYRIVRLEDGRLLPTQSLSISRPRWSVEGDATYLWGLGDDGVRRFHFDPGSGALGAGETVLALPLERNRNTLGVARDGSAVVVSRHASRAQIVRLDGLVALEEP